MLKLPLTTVLKVPTIISFYAFDLGKLNKTSQFLENIGFCKKGTYDYSG